MDFYFYPHQGGLFHPLNDRLSAVKRAGLYAECVGAVHKTLDFYRTTTTAEVYVDRIYRLVSRNTFAVLRDCRTNETGFDIGRVLRPTHRTIKLDSTDGTTFFGGKKLPSFALARRRIGPDLFEFEIPIPRNIRTRKELVAETFRFDRVVVVATAWPASLLNYTYVEICRGLPGYPVSVEVGGRVFSSPVHLKKKDKPYKGAKETTTTTTPK